MPAVTTPPLSDVVAARRLSHGAAKRLREQAGVSLRELAAYLGVDPAQVSRWENGLARPRPDAAVRWAKALDELRAGLARTLTGAER